VVSVEPTGLSVRLCQPSKPSRRRLSSVTARWDSGRPVTKKTAIPRAFASSKTSSVCVIALPTSFWASFCEFVPKVKPSARIAD